MAKQSSLFAGNALEVIPLDAESEVLMYSGWIPSKGATKLFDHFQQSVPWSQPEVVIAGMPHKVPRMQAWFGNPGAALYYSGARFEPLPWTAMLARMREGVSQMAGVEFNSVLVNLYRSEQDGVGWHADDEKELGEAPTIASVSLGAERVFSLRPKGGGQVRKIPLSSGDLLVMRGQTQKRWQHAVLKTAEAAGPRINLTFRKVFVFDRSQ